MFRRHAGGLPVFLGVRRDGLARRAPRLFWPQRPEPRRRGCSLWFNYPRWFSSPLRLEIGEERVLAADVGDAFRVEIDEACAVRRPGLGDPFAPRIPGDGAAVVDDAATATDAVYGDNVGLVLDGAGLGENVPVRTTRRRPVGDEDERVDVAGDGAKELGKSEVVADERRDANAFDGDRDRAVARRVC